MFFPVTYVGNRYHWLCVWVRLLLIGPRDSMQKRSYIYDAFSFTTYGRRGKTLRVWVGLLCQETTYQTGQYHANCEWVDPLTYLCGSMVSFWHFALFWISWFLVLERCYSSQYMVCSFIEIIFISLLLPCMIILVISIIAYLGKTLFPIIAYFVKYSLSWNLHFPHIIMKWEISAINWWWLN